MKQATLFDPPIVHRNDPITSHKAAEKMIKSGKLTKQQESVLKIIRKYCEEHEDFTPKEVAGGINALYFAIQRRKNELANEGLIKTTGEERNGCEVWKIKER